MKGLVFTTFYDFCAQNLGEDALDDVITASGVPNDGAYTSVGTYPFEEMVALITALCQITGLGMPHVLRDFGEFCFSKWVAYSPGFFDGKSLFDVLASIDYFHENEVRKLYPDAELPSFKVLSRTEDLLSLRYESCKPLADLAAGVIAGASTYLHSPVTISRSTVDDGGDVYVRFDIARLGQP
jgi:hypothetical protein